jgi:GWxTD domain-containing protein
MNQNFKLIIFFLSLFWVFACTPQHYNPDDLPPLKYSFSTIVKPLESKELMVVEVFVRVPKSELQFIRTKRVYTAHLELDVNLLNKSNERITGKIVDEFTEQKDYKADSNEESFVFSQFHFEIKPQEINVNVRLTDIETKRTHVLAQKADYTKFYNQNLVLGSCLVLINNDSALNIKKINFRRHVSDASDSIYFMLPIMGIGGPFDITADILKDQKTFETKSWTLNANTVDTLLMLSMPLNNLVYDHYNLVIRASNSTNESVGSESSFFYKLKGVSFNVGNIDEAIKQLLYIADRKSIEEMLVLNGDAKRKAFSAFWKKNDPTPDTLDNELMEEYYRRVAFAIGKFSYARNGWNTDMGMIYILFGSPDEIVRAPVEMNQYPNETWYYYQHDRHFLFVDRTGFGDYRLLSSLNEFGDWSFHY